MLPPDASAEEIHRELNVFARRVRAQAQRLHPDLSFVAYTLLAQVEASDGCRATDLVELYDLDKSTVSRQVADLERRGLVERAAGTEARRGLVLRATPAGRSALAAAAARQREALEVRLAGWEAADLDAFARYLRRLNAPGEAPTA